MPVNDLHCAPPSSRKEGKARPGLERKPALSGGVKNSPWLAPGLTLLEMMATACIIGLLAIIAMPTFGSLVPRYNLRSSANNLNAIMKQSRMTALNTQRPTRAVVDCRVSGGRCSLAIYTAVFDANGDLDKWVKLQDSTRELPFNIAVKPDSGLTTYPGTPDSNDLFWAVFKPDGQLVASHDPVRLVISSTAADVGKWTLSVSKSSGRVTLSK